ncbi:MAG: uroporphyrinogen decarboxylase family protein [Eubacteriales bacterium]
MNVLELRQERELIFDQLYSYKVPKRLISRVVLNQIFVMQYGEVPIVDSQYNFSLLEKSARELCEIIYSDTCPIQGGGVTSRFASGTQLIKSKTFQMGKDGFIQHPNVVGMEPNNYDSLINDPFACLVDIVIPKLYGGINPNDAITTLRNISMSKMSIDYDSGVLANFISKLVEEKGYYTPPRGINGFTAAPFDFLADQLRSFSGISMDIRRNPNKVRDACEALYPLMFKLGIPSKISHLGLVNTPLHMPTFMREKDVRDLWLPTYKRLAEQYAALGIRINAFCEDNWDRYLDLLLELPAGIQLRFEYGDIKKIKDKLGKKFIIGTNFPINLLKHGTKQECINKAKEIMDDTMDGGGVVFGFDKGNFVLSNVNIENLNAVLETVRDYGVYCNAGEPSCVAPLNSEKFEYDIAQDEVIASKYTFDWNEFEKDYPYAPEITRKRFQKFDEDTMKYYLTLLT